MTDDTDDTNGTKGTDTSLTIIPTVFERDGSVFADSRDVAAFFGKQHRNVLRDIDNLLKSDVGSKLSASFILSSGFDTYGRERRHYELTKDGFTLLPLMMRLVTY